jgi:ferric-dicitrate binding protein FerR (iron transport regulator)
LFKNNGQHKFLDLKSGDYLIYNKADETVSRSNTDIEKYIAWSRNILILDETPMEEVAILLERWYGVEVVIADSDIKSYRFTTKFENESLFQVLELLKLSSPINIEYIPGKICKASGKVNKSTVKITKKQ